MHVLSFGGRNAYYQYIWKRTEILDLEVKIEKDLKNESK